MIYLGIYGTKFYVNINSILISHWEDGVCKYVIPNKCNRKVESGVLAYFKGRLCRVESVKDNIVYLTLVANKTDDYIPIDTDTFDS